MNIRVALLLSAAVACSAQAIDVPGLRYVDRYNLPYTPGLNGTVFGNTLFGGISGMDYDVSSGSYYAISDDRTQNAPAGGNNAARFYNLSINVNQSGFVGANPVAINTSTAMLRPDGTTFPTLSVDPEAIRVRPNGSSVPTLLWTSEGAVAATGNPPLQNSVIREMNVTGSHIREFAVPAKTIPNAVGAGQNTGVRNNLGYEGLSLSLDGTRTYGAMESSLFQDGPRSTATTGSVNRFFEFDTATGAPTREFAYITDPIQAVNPANANDNGVSEILAISNDSFLVVERSFALGGEGNSIRIYSASFAGATDVSGFNSLVGQSFVPMTKTLLLTLNSAALGGSFNPDNIECLSVGPVLPNGEQSFFLVADNNFSATQNTTFIMLAVPSPAGLGVLGLGLIAAGRRRR
ncbi:MAG: esterase-like activity of phytase family protein [Phycisphaerae bacterium]|jgi:hypothetical protein